MTDLYMIRHGQATSNVEPVIADFKGNYNLTRFGVLQAERLRDRLAATGEIAADVLISSSVPRARQTAEIIAPALKLPVILDDEVQELRFGEADGMTQAELRENFGIPDLRTNPFRQIAPGGENWGQFVLRVSTALDRIIREQNGKTIVLVCHGGVIDSSFLFFFGMNTLTLPQAQFYTRNTSITHWQQDNYNNEQLQWRLERYNDDIHLRDMNTGKRIRWEDVAAQPVAGQDESAVPLPTEQQS